MALYFSKQINLSKNPDLTQANIDARILAGQYAEGTTTADIILNSDINAPLITDSPEGEYLKAGPGQTVTSFDLESYIIAMAVAL